MIQIAFIPGFINSVEEYSSEFAKVPSYLNVVGFQQLCRDKQPANDQKLTFDDQYIYLERQLKKSEKYIVFGVSTGATFATYLALKNPKNIIGLIIGDSLPRYRRLTSQWMNQVLKIKNKSVDNSVVERLFRDSEEIDFTDILLSIHCPIMILKGERSGFAFEQLPKSLKVDCRIIPNAGHDIFLPQPELVWKHVSHFARRIL